MERSLALLAELVNIDSGTGDAEGLAKVGAVLRRETAALKMNFVKATAKDGSEHFVAQRGSGPRLLLVAHVDTVFAKGTVARWGFSAAGDIARGPGVSDCKSGVVTILGALSQLDAAGWPEREIICFFNSDEEISSPGSREILTRLAQDAAAVIVVEPAEGETLTVARKGIGRFTIKVLGQAAHSGTNYQDGSNAVVELAHKILAVQSLTDLAAGVTLNVGVVAGGNRPNIVPDLATAEIDLRLVRPGQEERVIEGLKRITLECQVPGTKAKLSGGITRPPMPSNPGTLDLYEKFRVVADRLGFELGSEESGGGSDANLVAPLGVPVIDGVGPIGGGHHSDQEYLEIPSLYRRIDLLAEFLKDF
jgi:glutamate carboxypeptidase